jgi:hypothetical protein
MSGADITVLVLSVLAIAGLGWYFFAPRKGRIADLGEGVQKIAVTVKGGYSPDHIRARQGVPLSSSTGRSPGSAPTVWCSLTSASAPVYPRTPRPQCGSSRTGPARSVLPAA